VFDLARLVFVDKTGTSTNLLRLRGRVIRGEGLVDSVLHGRWKTITLLAGLRHDAIVAPAVPGLRRTASRASRPALENREAPKPAQGVPATLTRPNSADTIACQPGAQADATVNPHDEKERILAQ
jgi:hypothetical protein